MTRSLARPIQTVTAILSPTRFVIDVWKQSTTHSDDKAKRLLVWNRFWFWVELVIALALSIHSLTLGKATPPSLFAGLLVWVAASRCNEIAIAFLGDANRHLDKGEATSTLTPGQRIQMAMRSYSGLLVNFAVVAYFLPSGYYKPQFGNFVEALYFSGVTLATLGYGDISPQYFVSQLLALYEVLTGLLLIVVAVAVYVSAHGQKDA